MSKNRTDIRIDGREYTMVSTEPPEYILRVAAYVDRRMEEIKISAKLSSVMLAVLSALNITDELFKTQDENARMRKDLADTRQRLSAVQRELESMKETRAYKPPEIVPIDAQEPRKEAK